MIDKRGEHGSASTRTDLVYGINPAFELIRAKRREPLSALLSQSSKKNPRLKKLDALFRERGVPTRWTEKGRLIDLCGSHEHQGVVVTTSPYPHVSFEDIDNDHQLLLVDNIEDPRNLGAILRGAEVFGFHSVLLPLKGVPDVYPSVVKASSGAAEHLKICRDMNANSYAEKLKERGRTIIVLDAQGETPLRGFSPGGDPFLLVVGGENRSVGRHIMNLADHVVRVAQHGRINSLNASMAAGVAMHALTE